MRLFFFTLLFGTALADDGWQPYKDKGRIHVERRAVPGSKFFEHRAYATTRATPEMVEDAIWTGVMEALPKTVKKRTVISKSDDEYVVYDELQTPVVSDRDATIRIRRLRAEHRVTFETVNELGPPPNRHYVRLPVVRGGWQVAPDGTGSKITYTCYSEPGGSIPAWMVRGPQADQMFIDVQRILDRADARVK
jgi:hypothetical protein